MAAWLWLKRAMVFERFYELRASRGYCVAPVSVEKASEDVLPKKNAKKKDLAKIAAYEEYRRRVENLTVSFRDEYEAAKSQEKRRLEEVNQGSFSPYEQHKKAIEDINKYNENKDSARKGKEKEIEKRLKVRIQKEKDDSDRKRFEKNREMVLKVIEESKSFVTFENLEDKIQEVLSNETNYNFAITSVGTKIRSKEPPNNLGIKGPGPLAYQASGLRFFEMEKSLKTRRQFETVNETKDLSESSKSSDSDSSDEDVNKNSER